MQRGGGLGAYMSHLICYLNIVSVSKEIPEGKGTLAVVHENPIFYGLVLLIFFPKNPDFGLWNAGRSISPWKYSDWKWHANCWKFSQALGEKGSRGAGTGKCFNDSLNSCSLSYAKFCFLGTKSIIDTQPPFVIIFKRHSWSSFVFHFPNRFKRFSWAVLSFPSKCRYLIKRYI